MYAEASYENWFGWSIGALYLVPGRARARLGTLDVGLSAFSAAAAITPVRTTGFRLALDLGLRTGALHTAVRTPIAVGPSDRFYLVALGGARVRAALTPEWFVELGGQTVVSIARQELLVRHHPQDPVWRQKPVAGLGFLGTGFDFR
jgi:hypothetical protein